MSGSSTTWPARQLAGLGATALLAAVVAGVSLAASPDGRGALGAALGLLMLAIAREDARRFVVPDLYCCIALGLGLVDAAAADGGDWDGPLRALLQAGLAAAAFLAMQWLYRWFRRREGIGSGDVKLAGVAGAWLGTATLPIAIEIAAVGAIAVYAARQARKGRSLRAASRLPFGAVFAPTIWLVWLFDARFPPFT